MLWLFGSVNKIPFIALHFLALAVFFVPFTWTSFWLFVGFYYARMLLGISAGYHRLLSHDAFKAKRWFRFVLTFIASAAFQKGPLSWAANHRKHHSDTDGPEDPHSPLPLSWRKVWWSHIGWVLANEKPDLSKVRDLVKCRELCLLDRFHWIPGLCFLALCYFIDGITGAAWFVASTVVLYHMTFLVNSACHIPFFGKRRFDTLDGSRDLISWRWFLMVLLVPELIHNAHHARPSRARHGIRWWEPDFTYYLLWIFSQFGWVWDLYKSAPKTIDEIAKERGLIAAN